MLEWAGLQSIPLVHDPWHLFWPWSAANLPSVPPWGMRQCLCPRGNVEEACCWKGTEFSNTDVSCATHSCENSPGPILLPCTEIALTAGGYLVFVWFAGVYQKTNMYVWAKEKYSLCFSYRLFLYEISVWRPKWTSVHLLSSTQLWQQAWWLQLRL